jgi:hypothetical protein
LSKVALGVARARLGQHKLDKRLRDEVVQMPKRGDQQISCAGERNASRRPSEEEKRREKTKLTIARDLRLMEGRAR